MTAETGAAAASSSIPPSRDLQDALRAARELVAALERAVADPAVERVLWAQRIAGEVSDNISLALEATEVPA